MSEHTLPHNLEAERSVIGAILLHQEALHRATRIIGPSDFYRDAHRRIFDSMVRLFNAGDAVELVTLKNALMSSGQLDEVGGVAYLSSLLDGVPRAMNVEHYARIVKEKAQLRGLIFLANKMQQHAYEQQEDAADILKRTDQAVLRLQQSGDHGRMKSLADRTDAVLEDMEWRVNHKGELRGITTGFRELDDLTLGWRSGDLICIAARPSIGKSTFVKDMAVAGALSRRRDGTQAHVALYSLEMSKEQIEFRILAGMSGVPASVLDGGWLNTDEQWGAFTQALGRWKETNLHINDSSTLTVPDVRSECRMLQSKHGLDLVIIDYIQLMEDAEMSRSDNDNVQISHISRSLKKMADELQIPVIILSQLTRDAAKRGADESPRLHDLRGSGSLEQDAAIVMFLHRENHRVGGKTSGIIEKQRNGPTGSVDLWFDKEHTRFLNIEDAPEQPVTQAADEQPAKADDPHAKVREMIRKRAKRR